MTYPLPCTCGKPGIIFPCVGGYEKDGKLYGDFRGFCSDACFIKWRNEGEPPFPTRTDGGLSIEQPTLW